MCKRCSSGTCGQLVCLLLLWWWRTSCQCWKLQNWKSGFVLIFSSAEEIIIPGCLSWISQYKHTSSAGKLDSEFWIFKSCAFLQIFLSSVLWRSQLSSGVMNMCKSNIALWYAPGACWFKMVIEVASDGQYLSAFILYLRFQISLKHWGQSQSLPAMYANSIVFLYRWGNPGRLSGLPLVCGLSLSLGLA